MQTISGIDRYNIALALIKSIGYQEHELKYLGQGTYNTVFQGHHIKDRGVQVALKVVSGNKVRVQAEKNSAIELRLLNPKKLKLVKNENGYDFNVFQQRASAIAQKLNIPAEKITKRAKYFQKYINVPELLREFSGKEVLQILQKNAATRHKAEKLWSDTDNMVAYIFASPLAAGDAWSMFGSYLNKSADATSAKYKGLLYSIRKTCVGVLKALTSLHEKGRYHLDIKPDNILLFKSATGKMSAQLADFGLMDVGTTPDNCRITEEYSTDGQPYVKVEKEGKGDKSNSNSYNVKWKVTDPYKAPEQKRPLMLDRDQIDKIDIYALGMSLHELHLDALTSAGIFIMPNLIGNPGNRPLLERPSAYEELAQKNKLTQDDPTARTAEANLVNLVCQMTKFNPIERPTAQECLRHPFCASKIIIKPKP